MAPRINFAGYATAIRFAHKAGCVYSALADRGKILTSIIKINLSEVKTAKLERDAHFCN